MEPFIPLDHQRLQQAHKMMDFIDGARVARAQVEPPIEQLKEWVRTAYTDQGIEVDDALLEQALQSLRAHEPLRVPTTQAAPPSPDASVPWGSAAFKRAQDYLEAQPGGKFMHLLADSMGRVLALDVLAVGVIGLASLGIALANRAFKLVSTGQPVDVYAFNPWTEFVGNLNWWLPYALPFSAICLTLFVARGLARQPLPAWLKWLKGGKRSSARQKAQAAAHDALFGTREQARATASAILKSRHEGKDWFTVPRPGQDAMTFHRRHGRGPSKSKIGPLR